jgi:hypothetical protein
LGGVKRLEGAVFFIYYLFCMLHYYAVTLHAMVFVTQLPYNYIISSYTMCKAVVLTVVDDIVLYNLSKVILLVKFLKLLSYLVIS